MRNFLLSLPIISNLMICSSVANAESVTNNYNQKMIKCLETSVLHADESMTVKDLKAACQLLISQSQVVITNPTTIVDTKDASGRETTKPNTDVQIVTPSAENLNLENQNTSDNNLSNASAVLATEINHSDNNAPEISPALKDRLAIEALNRSNRFILTPHKRNYILPLSYSNHPNSEPYLNEGSQFTDLNHTEAEFQFSIKVLLRENIFDNNGHLYMGYTNHSLWQVYNRKISAPFRETDHEPELRLSFTNDWDILGFRNVLNDVVLNHQSNGQTGLQSRSWNRVMFTSIFEKDNIVFALTPWYRIPERKAEYPGDAGGDDNPDITHYMGHFELTGAYKYKSDIFSIQFRNNLESDNRGAIELGWTFPVTSTLRGYMTYFNGYGHSLIDYNAKEQMVGLGIIFTDLF